jgi:hypothetical protein
MIWMQKSSLRAVSVKEMRDEFLARRLGLTAPTYGHKLAFLLDRSDWGEGDGNREQD